MWGNHPVITADGRKIEAQRIAERGDHALVEDLSCAANFEKFDARVGNEIPINPPLWIAKTLRQRSSLKFPILTGVINAPSMRADGTILATPGYDRTMGLLFDPLWAEFPVISERPTIDEARAALELLNDLIATFPFVANVDRSVALSAILTALVRRSLRTAPLQCYTAPVAGTGKSMLVDINSIIATGHEAGVLAQGSDEGEMEKRLGAALLAGDPIISIDNCERPLGGQLICQMLTQARMKPRVLGLSLNQEITAGAFVMANGNNLRLVGDLTRRAIMCRLDAKCERPEMRVFERNPVALAKAERPKYVAAALTLLRAFHIAGRPSTVSPLGSFEEWSSLVRGALVWLGCVDPVESVEAIRQGDPKLADLETLSAQWWQTIGRDRVTVADVIKRATAQAYDGEFDHPDFREALLSVAGASGLINSRRLGSWLSDHAGRIVGGLHFERVGERQGVVVWRLAGHVDPTTSPSSEDGFIKF